MRTSTRPRTRLSRRIAYQKALLAVYFLSDDEDGLQTLATNEELCRAAGGLARTSLRLALAEMELRGVIASFDIGVAWDAPSGRVLVLLDHPDSLGMVQTWQAYLDSRSRRKYELAQARAIRNRGRAAA